MQQLAHWQYDLDHNTLLLVGTHLPKWDEFPIWCENFCQAPMRKVSFEQGADRQQLQFTMAENDFLLCYESLCEAIWIEAMNQQTSMQALREKLVDCDIHQQLNHL